MKKDETQIIVAGHICLDIIPDFKLLKGDFKTILSPGKLVNVGPVTISTGGPVSNTGLALHRLGVPTQLMGKIGDDKLGEVILEIIKEYDPNLAAGMIVESGNNTSYTLVINPPGVDRIFFHHPGANDTFKSKDVIFDDINEEKIFHFGYPPLMKKMYINDGADLENLLKRAKQKGFITSLDMAFPDPDSEAGQVDWIRILKKVLPFVDIFLPSIDEISFMLKFKLETDSQITAIADLLMEMGAGIVVIKLGDKGLFLRTSAEWDKLNFLKNCGYDSIQHWIGRELYSTCFKVNVAGTTGAGDSTIAGFLAAIMKTMDPIKAMISAVAVGACNVEALDALAGVQPWDKIQDRIKNGWEKHPPKMNLSGWKDDEELGICYGPADGK